MSPQFVDFDLDGSIDIVTATYDGSPYVAWGGEGGFAQPQVLRDARGQRLLLGKYWDYETASWDTASWPVGDSGSYEHATSAVAFDWDDDGDHDLILGDHDLGRLYLQLNVSPPTPRPAQRYRFSGHNETVSVDGSLHHMTQGLAGIRAIDWDRDGRMDLLLGGLGELHGLYGKTGGVWLLPGVRERGEAELGTPFVLLDAHYKSGAEEPREPEAGLYPHAADYDGDGDLDLLVGGYGMWAPPQPKLDARQLARVGELEKQIRRDASKLRFLARRATRDQEDEQAALAELRQSTRHRELSERVERARAELEQLQPSERRESAIWLYERIAD